MQALSIRHGTEIKAGRRNYSVSKSAEVSGHALEEGEMKSDPSPQYTQS